MTNYESTTVGHMLLWCRGGNVVISFEVSQKSKPNKNQPNFIWIYWVWRPLWKSCKTAARRTAIWLWDVSFKKCATEMCDGQIRRTPCKGAWTCFQFSRWKPQGDACVEGFGPIHKPHSYQPPTLTPPEVFPKNLFGHQTHRNLSA